MADALEREDFATVRRLLEEGAKVDEPQPDGTTALHWAVHHDQVELTRVILQQGANAHVANRNGVTPLFLACQNGNTEIVELLLEAGADANTTQAGGETVLMTAARTGQVGPVLALLKRGAQINAEEQQGQTALMWAAAEGNLDVVDALLDAGADYKQEVRSGFTALFFAVREGKIPVALRLLEAGANVNGLLRPNGRQGRGTGNGTTALLLAVENGHFDLAAELLKAGADPNLHPSGYTPLHALTWVRKPIRGDGDPPPIGSGTLTSLGFVPQIVAAGGNVNARLEKGTSGRGRFTTTGATPFLMAARASDIPLMKLLLELGADPEIPNADHSPALLAAAGVGALGDGDEAAGTNEEALATVKFLLELGADPNAVDDNGETAMHGAAYQSWPLIVNLLTEHQADIKVWNAPNQWGWTPLMIAEGHRPGNFRPAPDTIQAIRKVMLANGVMPPSDFRNAPERNEYSADNKPQRPDPPLPLSPK